MRTDGFYDDNVVNQVQADGSVLQIQSQPGSTCGAGPGGPSEERLCLDYQWFEHQYRRWLDKSQDEYGQELL